MRRAVMRLVLNRFTSYLLDKFPPSGKPFVYDLEAEARQLIEAVPAGSGPDITEAEKLDENGVSDILSWIFKSVIDANAGHRGWGLACHALRVYALEHSKEILEKIQAPPGDPQHDLLPSIKAEEERG